MMSRHRLRYVLALSRPRFWLYLAGPVLIGVAYAAETPADLVTPLTVALFGYFLVPANVYLYGINDVFDADVDAANPKKDAKEVRYRGESFIAAVVAACGLALVAFVPFVPALTAWWLAGFALLATEYSAPPLRFKTTPGLDSLSNGLYVLPGVAAYTAVAGHNPPILAVAGGWLWAMGMHTFSAIPDIGPDRDAGIQTTATVLGASRTYAYCALVWTLAAAAFALVDWRFGALLAVYPLVAVAVPTSDVDVTRAYWYFPAINTLVGMAFTMGGLWVMFRG